MRDAAGDVGHAVGMTVKSFASSPVISVMLIVPDAAAAVDWYKTALETIGTHPDWSLEEHQAFFEGWKVLTNGMAVATPPTAPAHRARR